MKVTGRHAVISDDGVYRYNLYRSWDEGNGTIMFVMLNPSTADADIDDPTIRRCIGFAHREEFQRLVVGNVFALRATDPKELDAAAEPVGPENYHYLRLMAAKADAVILAYGANRLATFPEFINPVLDLLEDEGHELECLGVTAAGAPRHPLYLPDDTEVEAFER